MTNFETGETMTRIECGTESDPNAIHIAHGVIYVTRDAAAAPATSVLLTLSFLAAIVGWFTCRLVYRIHR